MSYYTDDLHSLSHQSGSANIILYLRQSIEEKSFMMQEDWKLERY